MTKVRTQQELTMVAKDRQISEARSLIVDYESSMSEMRKEGRELRQKVDISEGENFRQRNDITDLEYERD